MKEDFITTKDVMGNLTEDIIVVGVKSLRGKMRINIKNYLERRRRESLDMIRWLRKKLKEEEKEVAFLNGAISYLSDYADTDGECKIVK